jgi:Uma2 family endonuclease
MTLPDAQPPQVHRFTRDEFLRMADAGLFQEQRAELIEGEIIDMAPQRNTHALAVTLVLRELMKAYPGDWVRCQMPLSLGPRSEPEPDVAVVPGTPESHAGRTGHPSAALLVVEISDTTLAFDRGAKHRIYARSGVTEYWIINLIAQTLESHREPDVAGERYREQQVLRKGDSIVPPSVATAIPVDRLLP